MTPILTFELDIAEAQFLYQVLGNLPTQMAALPLFQKWEKQLKAQAQSSNPTTEVEIVSE